MPRRKSEKVEPIGDVMPLDELMAMAEVMPADVKRAAKTWRKAAPKGTKKLLDAKPKTPKKK